jgi:hypothetical protein
MATRWTGKKNAMPNIKTTLATYTVLCLAGSLSFMLPETVALEDTATAQTMSDTVEIAPEPAHVMTHRHGTCAHA